MFKKNVIRYIVKPEDKVVIGIVEKPGALSWATRKILNGDERWIIADTDEWHEGSKKYKAVARCTDGDTFDEAIGKRIVGLKLNFKWSVRVANDLIKCAHRLIAIAEKLTNESDMYIAKAHEYANMLDTFTQNGDPDALR